MVWKSYSPAGQATVRVMKTPAPPQKEFYTPLVIAHGVSAGLPDHYEGRNCIDDKIFQLARKQNRLFASFAQNSRDFDQYVGLPFIKGMTDRETGQSLIIESDLHHMEAGSQYFPDMWRVNDISSYGNKIRWFNIGDQHAGCLGLDYNPTAKVTGGVARSPADIAILARHLIDIGFYNKKPIFMMQPPNIIESPHGKRFRSIGLETLADWGG